ncbi:MAG TPA: RNA methyltransferase [Stellaceae bacterium]|nr:RNA methyltransferase [Stellaceae bacterium]
MPRPSSPPRSPRRSDRGSPPRAPGHERDLVCVCGLAAVAALFARDAASVERLFFEPRLTGALAAPRRALAKARKPYREVAADELARIAGTVRHGGVVAVARPRPLTAFDPALAAGWARDRRPLLLLDGIGNPHNLGAIVRSAAYFGVERIVLAERPEQALPSAASYRIAEGALDRVTLYRAPFGEVLPVLRRSYRVVGSAIGQGVPLAAWRSDRPVALILGNEESGIAAATLALCDAVVTIPGAGAVQSLNVAAAAAVLLYGLTAV